jgi:hypothetical protein
VLRLSADLQRTENNVQRVTEAGCGGAHIHLVIIILVIGRLKQKNHEFQDNLDYLARPCLRKTKKRKKK